MNDRSTAQSATSKHLLFSIGEDVYGLGIDCVTEIVEMQKITEVPDTPEFLKGVINLRGRVIPVMDLRLRLGLPERRYDNRSCIIVVEVDESTMGFIVDTVAEVQEIAASDIDPPPSLGGTGSRDQYIRGMAKVGAEVRILIDPGNILRRNGEEG